VIDAVMFDEVNEPFTIGAAADEMPPFDDIC
jgi:hypothetical protein